MKHLTCLSAVAYFSLCSNIALAEEDVYNSIGRMQTTVFLPPEAVQEQDTVPSNTNTAIRDISELTEKVPAPYKNVRSAEGAKAATQRFLSDNASDFGIADNASEFLVVETRETLTGTTVDVEQRLNGLRVLDGGIQINFSGDGSLQSVTRNVVAVPNSKAGNVSKFAKISENDAREIAWRELVVAGELLEKPSVEKVYVDESNALTMAYLVRIAVSDPFGYWEYTIDASTGRVISKRDRRIKEDKVGAQIEASKSDRKGTSISFSDAMRSLEARSSAFDRVILSAKAAAKVSASGLVFAPNPISTLVDPTLRDNDPPSRFEKAYKTVNLEGITRLANKFMLTGTEVRILDFEPGDGGRSRPPSSVADQWVALRGDNAFNDVMTYFHVYNEIQYLRSLGYRDGKELFPTGLDVDSDGVNGDDNSHYVPSSDRIAFGHGCVDDNEDTDVILHEFGHALHYHLNHRWTGGDSGAIGEGFGDYWAVSRRMRMPNGVSVDKGKVFVWDGSSGCWSGRRVDRINASYNPQKTYVAHERLNGFESDELWSTPLVGALNELVASGESGESVDAVILAGMGAAGSAFTMRSLAKVTIDQARLLYPNHPHASVLERHFKAMEILE
jgi:Fungalysin/Thermolysin Propeptide Motif